MPRSGQVSPLRVTRAGLPQSSDSTHPDDGTWATMAAITSSSVPTTCTLGPDKISLNICFLWVMLSCHYPDTLTTCGSLIIIDWLSADNDPVTGSGNILAILLKTHVLDPGFEQIVAKQFRLLISSVHARHQIKDGQRYFRLTALISHHITRFFHSKSPATDRFITGLDLEFTTDHHRKDGSSLLTSLKCFQLFFISAADR